MIKNLYNRKLCKFAIKENFILASLMSNEERPDRANHASRPHIAHINAPAPHARGHNFSTVYDTVFGAVIAAVVSTIKCFADPASFFQRYHEGGALNRTTS